MIYPAAEDSYLLQKHIKDYSNDKKILDIGTGSGILAIEAAKFAKEVVAIDINPHAIKYAKKQAMNIKNIKFIESDLFLKIKSYFDLILFNPPYLPEEEHVKDIALVSGKYGMDLIVRFLEDASDFLNNDGKILLVSSSHAKQQLLFDCVKNNLLEIRLIDKTHVFFEDILLYEIKKNEFLEKLHELKVKEAKLFARGKRGIIIKAKYKNKTVAIKKKRIDSDAIGNIEREAMFLKVLNNHKIGPKLIMSHDFLMYEFVEGVFIDEFLKNKSREDILMVLRRVMEQMHKMDILGINKFEMNRPHKHILIKDNYPVQIDFERCRYAQQVKNVTQFLDYLVGKDINKILLEKNILIERKITIKLSKEYKKNKDIKKIMKLFDEA